MDGLTLSRIVAELREEVLGARVERVRLADPSTLLMKLYRPHRRPGHVWLLLSVAPRWPRVHLVEHVPEESAEPTPFLLLVRARLRGARLRAIEQVRCDRLVRFSFERRASVPVEPGEDADEGEMSEGAGDAADEETILVAELFGRAANLFLLDASGRVRERLQAHGQAPGEVYTPPASEKRDPWTLDREEFRAIVSGERPLAESLKRTIEGFGSLYATEVEARWREMSPAAAPSPDLAYAAFRSVLEDLARSRHPILYSREPLERWDPARASPRDVLLSAIPLSQAKGWSATRWESFSQAAEVYYDLVRRAERFQQMRTALQRHLAAQIEKRERLRKRLDEDQRALGDPELWRRWGELLLANAHTAVRVASGFLLTDHYDPEQRVIEIPTSAATPQQAAAEYFQRYRKAKQGARVIAERQAVIKRELEELRRIQGRVETADALPTLEYIARDLGLAPSGERSAGKRPTPTSPKRGAARIPGVYHFRSSDGFDILVGKSAEDNERLTFRVAAPHDIWLHAADYPGSHVIIRRAKGQVVPPRTLLEAAQLAAFFSQARHSSTVVVAYTERKFVSKIPRSKPGLVRLSEFRSLTVEPKIAAERVLTEG
jgi:predicted ribosome quality control (RQC) complex YloA/Tae2 family protein